MLLLLVVAGDDGGVVVGACLPWGVGRSECVVTGLDGGTAGRERVMS